MTNNNSMVIRINGKSIDYSSSLQESLDKIKLVVNPVDKKRKIVSVSMYSISGVLLASQIVQTNPSMWKEMVPIFGIFQEIAMVVGALAVLGGLVVMIFKKRIGMTIIYTAGAVVLGCFLVPSAVMLVAIVGKMLNGAFMNAFDAFNAMQ